MNILQHLPESKHGLVLVTLNPPFPPDPSKVVASFKYQHPMMTNTSVATQPLLPGIQNTRGISYVGAWTKYGFHEDGFASAFKLLINAPFNVKPPFPLRPAQRTINSPSIPEHCGRIVISLVEKVRRAVDASGLWVIVSWLMILLLVITERGASALGAQSVGKEAKRLRGYWTMDKVKLA